MDPLEKLLTRRRFLELSGSGIGAAALATLYNEDLLAQVPNTVGGLPGLPPVSYTHLTLPTILLV